jgi:DNA-binding NtrC family response regulator
MKRALVVERNTEVRQDVERALQDADYAVAGLADASLLLPALRVSPFPLVVVMGHGDDLAGSDGPALLRGVASAAETLPHVYVVVSGHPEDYPSPPTNPHTHRAVPVVYEPLALDTLVAAVELAAERLSDVALD